MALHHFSVQLILNDLGAGGLRTLAARGWLSRASGGAGVKSVTKYEGMLNRRFYISNVTQCCFDANAGRIGKKKIRISQCTAQ